LAFDEGPHVERVKQNDNRRWPFVALGVVVVALLAFAALRPMVEAGPDRSFNSYRPDLAAAAPGSARSPGSARPEGTTDPNALFAQCFPSLTWRVASLQQQPYYKVRTAWPVSAAPSPTAPATTTPTLFGPGVEAIGFCTPGTDDLTREQYVGDVTLWRKSTDGRLDQIDGTVIDTTLAEHGEVYLAPPPSVAVNGTWPTGDYFFQVRPRGAQVSARAPGAKWLALRIVPTPPRKPR
jgi:hypothetical protein